MSTYPIEELEVDTIIIAYENNELRISPIPSFIDKDIVETPVTKLIIKNPRSRRISDKEYILEKRKHDLFYESDSAAITQIGDLFKI